MEHHAQALLALSISAALCLGTVATTKKLSIYISRPRAIRTVQESYGLRLKST
jgi:hypothetical protein